MDLSNDISELKSLVEGLLARVNELEQANAALKQENTALKTRLKQNSKNSHKPPSSDYKKNKTKPAIPRKKGKKKGGQEGHKGKTLEKSDSPDKFVTHMPEDCSCGRSLSEVPKDEVESRQVFDIPEPKLEVTEHTIMGCTCPSCGKNVSADFPSGVNSRVQYGDRVKALSVVLLTSCNLSYSRVKTFFGDVFGCDLNESTQFSAQQKCYDLLASAEEVIKEKLMQSPVNHFDETGLRVAGRNHWLHSGSNASYTYLFVHEKRGNKAIGSEQSILPDYNGVAVHDCWSTYFLHKKADHALCNAHLIRELRAISEAGRSWSKRMSELLLYAYYQSKNGTSVVKDFNLISRQYDKICKMADEEPPPSQKERSQAQTV